MNAKHKNNKKIRAKEKPRDKSARKSNDPDNFNSMKPTWMIGQIDRSCDWGWENISLDEFWTEIYSKLKSFESMNWTQIIHSGSHNVKICDFIPEAQKRLDELYLDDLEELFSLRLTGEKRIWGIKNQHILSIIWYDPEHKICPSLKKHT